MSKVQERIDEIKSQQLGNRVLRVLVVEGPDDRDAFQQFLAKRVPAWESHWVLAEAGGKRQVLQILKQEIDWVGVVDRDDWSDEEQAEHVRTYPNLFVLPRFCLESYLINPDELWAAFPDKQRAKLPGGLDDLKAAFAASLPEWIRHAALWHVINPLWRKLRALGFVDEALNTQSIPDDAALIALLNRWVSALDSQQVLLEFHERLLKLQQLSPAELTAHWLYAKKFYPEVVHPLLDRLLGTKSSKARRLAIFRTLPVPVDMETLWKKMGLVP